MDYFTFNNKSKSKRICMSHSPQREPKAQVAADRAAAAQLVVGLGEVAEMIKHRVCIVNEYS